MDRYKKRRSRIAECQRKLVATRKKQHGELCNKVMSLGKIIRTEKLSYRSFQKNFGRSVGVRAPGMFVNLLTRKAANAGGSVEQINTRTTKLSQIRICGTVEKKPLKQRHHACACGVEAQRDLFSAFLAKHCSNHTLDIHQAKSAPLIVSNFRIFPQVEAISARVIDLLPPIWPLLADLLSGHTRGPA